MRRDPDQMSIFDDEDDRDYTADGYIVIRPPVPTDPKFKSNKPLLKFRIRGYSYHEEAGPKAIVYAVSINQAKFLYDDKTGHWYKYAKEVSRIV